MYFNFSVRCEKKSVRHKHKKESYVRRFYRPPNSDSDYFPPIKVSVNLAITERTIIAFTKSWVYA